MVSDLTSPPPHHSTTDGPLPLIIPPRYMSFALFLAPLRACKPEFYYSVLLYKKYVNGTFPFDMSSTICFSSYVTIYLSFAIQTRSCYFNTKYESYSIPSCPISFSSDCLKPNAFNAEIRSVANAIAFVAILSQ